MQNGKAVASENVAENLLGYLLYTIFVIQLIILPFAVLFFVQHNLDPASAIVNLARFHSKTSFLFRYLLTYLTYGCATRWILFCTNILLIALLLGVAAIKSIWFLQDSNSGGIFIARSTKRSILETMLRWHHVVSITCQLWSYSLGHLISALLVGGSLFWGIVDYLIVSIETDEVTVQIMGILVVSSMVVKLTFVTMVERASKVHAASTELLEKLFKCYGMSRYCAKLINAEKSARIFVPYFYFSKELKVHLLKIPVEFTLNFLCTFGHLKL